MDPHANGHDDDGPDAPPARPRLRGDGRPASPSSAQSLRAADQLARLEARIREFHANLDALDAGAPEREPTEPPSPRTSAEAGAVADDLVRRAAAAARAASIGTHVNGHGNGNGNIDAAPKSDAPNGDAPAASIGDIGQRRRRSDRADGPFSAQRRIDALRPEPRGSDGFGPPPANPAPAAPPPSTLEARVHAEEIQQEAERRAERLHRDAAREAAQIRQTAEQEMQELWQALEAEVEAIQTAISERVDSLAERMEAVGREAEHMHSTAVAEAERLRASAAADAAEIRRLASEDAEELLSIAEREAHALIAQARNQAEAILAPAPEPDALPERNAAERIAEQIRDATAALTRRVSRAVEDSPNVAREIRSPGAIPGSIREVLDGLVSAVSLIERSLTGLAELLGDTLGADDDREDL